MKWLLVCLIFKSFVVGIILASCPNGTVQSKLDQNVCYLFSNKNYTFLNAESICVENNGHLVSIHSMFDNVFINEQTQMKFPNYNEIWIGATNLMTSSSETWGWIDKASFSFTDWQKSEPKNNAGFDCGAVKVQDGTWVAENCHKLNPFVCMITIQPQTTTMQPITTKASSTSQIATAATIPPTASTTKQPKSCPESWIFSNITGFCYTLLRNQYTWLDAENSCASQNSHLASIHSSEENKFVNENGFTGLILFNNMCGIYAYIGLHYVTNTSTWAWTDNTPFDYSDWVYFLPTNVQNYQCASLEDGHACAGSGSGSWTNSKCTGGTYSYAICKKQPS